MIEYALDQSSKPTSVNKFGFHESNLSYKMIGSCQPKNTGNIPLSSRSSTQLITTWFVHTGPLQRVSLNCISFFYFILILTFLDNYIFLVCTIVLIIFLNLLTLKLFYYIMLYYYVYFYSCTSLSV